MPTKKDNQCSCHCHWTDGSKILGPPCKDVHILSCEHCTQEPKSECGHCTHNHQYASCPPHLPKPDAIDAARLGEPKNCTCHEGKNDCKEHPINPIIQIASIFAGYNKFTNHTNIHRELEKILLIQRKQAVRDCIKFMEAQRELMTARDTIMLGSEAIEAAKEFLKSL